jgi:hypothetical protein
MKSSKTKIKKYNKVKAVKSLAREQVGQPKPTRYIEPKRDRQQHEDDMYAAWCFMRIGDYNG